MNSTQAAPRNAADLALRDADIDVENAHRDLLLDAKRFRDRLARFIAELEVDEEQASIDPGGVLKESGVELDQRCARLAFSREKRAAVRKAVGAR